MTIFSPRFLLLAFLVAAFSVCLLVPGLNGGFIFDDKPNIVQNTSLHVQGGAGLDEMLYATYSFQPGNGSRALTMFSFALDHWRGGLDARVFKTTNLLIHGLTVCVLILFMQKLLRSAGWDAHRAGVGALVISLVWAIHPLQVSSVLYVVQRMQTLATLFALLTMWAYLCMRQRQIEGGSGRAFGALSILFGVLGFASKEDAVLFPFYTFLLEVTVLRFAAASPRLSSVLRATYFSIVFIGGLLYLLVVVPKYWHWDAYPGRDFTSYERLLTQARVLLMYMRETIFPVPGTLPFYYDDLIVSRGVFLPITTFVSLLLAALLIVWAIAWRNRRPLFAFGVFFFFAGHFMTSNILNLELAFEHRNQLPMLGIILAVVCLCAVASEKLSTSNRRIGAIAVFLLTLGMAGGTILRAHEWGDPLRFSERSIEISPLSERAWLQLASVYADRSNMDPQNPDFVEAIKVTEKGAESTQSAPLWSNVVVYKTVAGTVAFRDWVKLLQRMREVPMSAQNQNILWTMLNNVDRGTILDQRGMLELIAVVSERSVLTSSQYLRIAAYIHNDTHSPEEAFKYLELAVAAAPPSDPEITVVFEQLKDAGRVEWVRRLESRRPEVR